MGRADLRSAKRELRRQVRARREALTLDERELASAEIGRRALLEIERVAPAGTVMAFWSFGSEVSTDALLAELLAAGHRLALPRIHGGELEARTFQPGEPTTETTFGAREPAAGDLVPAGDLDVVLTPGLAFDRRGYRVGYGGGFYDRFLRGTRPDALRLAIAFAIQVLEEIPSGELDERIDVIVTEAETIRCDPVR